MSNETESALVGAIILDPSQIDITQGIVSATDFTDLSLGRAYALMIDMHSAGEPVGDGVLLAKRLDAAGILATIGGRSGLAKLAMAAGSTQHAKAYASEIRDAATIRRIESLGLQIAELCTSGRSPQEIAAWVDTQLRACLASEANAESITIAAAASNALKKIDEAARRERSLGLPTGLYRVDDGIGGLYPGELAILAARPSIGKSALAAQIASYNAMRQRPVLFVSLEMTSHDIALRSITGETGIDGRLLRAGQITKQDRQTAQNYAESLAGVPLYLWSARDTTVAKIRSAAKLQAATTGLSLLVVDYIGLVHGTDRRAKKFEQINEVSNDLKSIALEMDIPVLALCQLNREAEKSPPRLDHLRDSGAIEQDADIVMLLHRESRDAKFATLDIAKARNAVTGQISLGFDPSRVMFTDTNDVSGDFY